MDGVDARGVTSHHVTLRGRDGDGWAGEDGWAGFNVRQDVSPGVPRAGWEINRKNTTETGGIYTGFGRPSYAFKGKRGRGYEGLGWVRSSLHRPQAVVICLICAATNVIRSPIPLPLSLSALHTYALGWANNRNRYLDFIFHCIKPINR